MLKYIKMLQYLRSKLLLSYHDFCDGLGCVGLFATSGSAGDQGQLTISHFDYFYENKNA